MYPINKPFQTRFTVKLREIPLKSYLTRLNTSQLLDEAEYDLKSYADRGG